jgi:hypothetical protein
MLKPPIGVSSGESKSSKRDNMVIFISLTSWTELALYEYFQNKNETVVMMIGQQLILENVQDKIKICIK